MVQPLSKLMVQLSKQQKITHRSSFNEEDIDEVFNTICKFQSKNLLLIQFLGLIIEKDFVKNSNKLVYFVDLFQEVRVKYNDEQVNLNKNQEQFETQKITKKKFIRLLKQMAKKLYPGNPQAYETTLYDKITSFEAEDHRIKFDDTVKKMMSKEVIYAINQIDQELQTIFEIYMPENYNYHLDFAWDQIKILEKKLPIICFLRFLFEAEIVPQYITPVQFLEIISKLKPPNLPNSTNSKQVLFYTTETMTNYMKDYINFQQIKILQGDLGLNFFEFQLFFMRVASEFMKDAKGDILANIKKFVSFIKLKQAFDQNLPRKNKFMESVRDFIKIKTKNQKLIVKKRQSKKKIQQLFDTRDMQLLVDSTKNVYQNMAVTQKEVEAIKKDLDNELAELPPKKKIQKQNQGFYDIQKKHIVIGQQLPKIIQKNKAAAPKDPKKKNQDVLLGYRPQVIKEVQDSNTNKIIQRPRKIRLNNEFPIILNEVFYPSNLQNQVNLPAKAEVYLQTSYIHLGERLYQEAYINYNKAMMIGQTKNTITELFYKIHGAQIFESAGRDTIALSLYHKAKQLTNLVNGLEPEIKSYPYIGMGSCFYHLEEYDYAMRCFEKARSIYGLNIDIESLGNAILQNNIGCCLMMMNRNQEAMKYFEISHNIFDLKVGTFDQRTLVVQQNFNKNRKAYLEMLPEFKTMWKTYMEKNNTKLPLVKGGKAKK